MKHLERAVSSDRSFITSIAFILFVVIAFLVVQMLMAPIILLVIYASVPSISEHIGLGDTESLLQLLDSNTMLFVLMVPFVISLLTLIFMLRLLYKRNFSEMINGTKSIRWQRVRSGFICWFVIMGLVTLIQYLVCPEDFTFQFELSRFIPLLVISLLLIPIQTTFEEAMVRGYLAQEVGNITRNRWMVLLIPSILFASLHLANPEIQEYGLWIMVATYFSMAAIWGLISILDDGIELAMGMHAANNIFISLFTTQKGAAFETNAVFEIAKSDPYVELAILLLSGGVLFLFFYKMYGWDIRVMNRKVEKDICLPDSVD